MSNQNNYEPSNDINAPKNFTIPERKILKVATVIGVIILTIIFYFIVKINRVAIQDFVFEGRLPFTFSSLFTEHLINDTPVPASQSEYELKYKNKHYPISINTFIIMETCADPFTYLAYCSELNEKCILKLDANLANKIVEHQAERYEVRDMGIGSYSYNMKDEKSGNSWNCTVPIKVFVSTNLY